MARPATTASRILRHTRSPVWWGFVLLLVALLASYRFVGHLSELGQRSEQQQGLARVQTAAALLDAAQVAALQGTASDAGTPAHERLRASLRAIRAANPEFRFVYLMRPLADRGGALRLPRRRRAAGFGRLCGTGRGLRRPVRLPAGDG